MKLDISISLLLVITVVRAQIDSKCFGGSNVVGNTEGKGDLSNLNKLKAEFDTNMKI